MKANIGIPEKNLQEEAKLLNPSWPMKPSCISKPVITTGT